MIANLHVALAMALNQPTSRTDADLIDQVKQRERDRCSVERQAREKGADADARVAAAEALAHEHGVSDEAISARVEAERAHWANIERCHAAEVSHLQESVRKLQREREAGRQVRGALSRYIGDGLADLVSLRHLDDDPLVAIAAAITAVHHGFSGTRADSDRLPVRVTVGFLRRVRDEFARARRAGWIPEPRPSENPYALPQADVFAELVSALVHCETASEIEALRGGRDWTGEHDAVAALRLAEIAQEGASA